ncbi:MAG: CDGSH iron-sulfur domain-containing protein [Hyphomicrobiaceae bacterium]
MKTRIHAVAGGIGFLTILTFWTSTVFSELFASHEMIASVKQMILYGMVILIPAMAIAGGSGMFMGKARTDALALAKKKRMPLIAANGLIVLLPSAFFLASKAATGSFDAWFYGVQTLELIAGAVNLTMMGLNIRDGLTMTGRIGSGQTNAIAANRDEAVIEERDGGPLVAKNVSRLTGIGGEAIDVKPTMALCRCGASKNKPFCDGSHNEIGFDDRPTDTRTPDRLRSYEGREIAVHYNRLLCSHAGECGKLTAVFDPSQKPWIRPDNGTVDDIIEVVKVCPSGALSYSLPGQTRQHANSDIAGISLELNGPYRVTAIPLGIPRSAAGANAGKYVLCRCGASKNKPYCDGTHSDIGWKD